MAANTAVSVGDRSGAVRDLATMAMYINRAPGILATAHLRAEADVLIAEARALSDDSPLAGRRSQSRSSTPPNDR